MTVVMRCLLKTYAENVIVSISWFMLIALGIHQIWLDFGPQSNTVWLSNPWPTPWHQGVDTKTEARISWLLLNPTHTRLTALCLGLPGWAGTRKVKPISILLRQETVSGSGISWAICKAAPRSRQITIPAPHRSVFLQAGCPSCSPTNSVKTLKARALKGNW